MKWFLSSLVCFALLTYLREKTGDISWLGAIQEAAEIVLIVSLAFACFHFFLVGLTNL